MKKGLTITLILLLVLSGIITIPGMALWNHRNVAVSLEQKIDSQLQANKSEYDSMWKKFQEEAQVTELQATQFKEVYDGLIQGRYSNEGEVVATQNLFKVIKEDNPNMDTSVYSRLQQDIINSRDSFNNSQKKVLDVIREYNTYIEKKPIMKLITGREQKDMSKYIVTSDKTDKAFDSGNDNNSFKLK